MTQSLDAQKRLYAELLIQIGVNLQPGQGLVISAELGHAEMARLALAAAYRAGAKYVHIGWLDAPSNRGRLLNSQPDHLDYVPELEVARFRQYTDENWARLAIVGDEFPDIYSDVDPALIRRAAVVRAQKLKFYAEAQMSNQFQWCVASVPTAAWAGKVFPSLDEAAAIEALWAQILKLVRADQPDTVAAWQAHDTSLRKVTEFFKREQVRSIRYLDNELIDDRPATDLSVGLTERPVWVAASATTPSGVRFLPNMPTEEVFTSPHRMFAEGYIRTSKPSFFMEREVKGAFVRFKDGEVVEFRAHENGDVLKQFFEIPGSRRLGEVSLVDVRSPVNQSGLLFYETLFDENAACHIAFGKAYSEGMEMADALSEDERIEAGLNQSDTHVDVMIGTPTMNVYGTRADGSQVTIMENGQFVAAVIGG